jgi:NADH dehydrogenase
MAGAIAELARISLLNDFRRIKPAQTRIVLIEGGKRVLSAFSEELSEKALACLKKLGVEVILNSLVTDISATHVRAGDLQIHARTVVWGAGVKASPLSSFLCAPLDRVGRVLVAPDLSVPQLPFVYVVGDLAAVPWKEGPSGAWVPGVAPAANQGGRLAARNIVRTLRNEKTEEFSYVDKGNLATIGRAAAVAEVKGLKVNGFFAWILWLVVHIIFLIGFRNRIIVLIQWAWAYLFYKRGARLITNPHPHSMALPRNR